MTGPQAALLVALAVWLAWPGQVPPRRAAGHDAPRRACQHSAAHYDPSGVALAMELLAAALASGCPVPAALEVVARSGPTPVADELFLVARRLSLGANPDEAWAGTAAALAPVRRTVTLVLDAGIPASALLRAAAADLRRNAVRDAETRAAQLGVRLVLPLGLCALPAFVAWSVVPVVVWMASSLAR